MPSYLLAIDQGTTSSRAIVFSEDLTIVSLAQEEFPQHYPASGWVEHDAEDIWRSTVSTMREAVAKAGVAPGSIAAIGITNQRETVVIWDRETGQAIHPAIVWQDRRTAQLCATLKASGHEPMVRERTGLLLDPYFSATKAAFILDQVPGARQKAADGKLAFGTIDTFLLWRLTGGRVHATDATNASRTMLLNIHTGAWDADLCAMLNVPMAILPMVKNSADVFGTTISDLLGVEVPVLGMAGDQQAALVGQACFSPGMMKSTYGTGCFALLNTGEQAYPSQNRLLTTIAYQLQGKRSYALEGSIFIAGAAVQWLRDGLGIITEASETGALAMAADPAQNVYLVPAFVGLGAPWWDAEARGALYGLTRGTTKRELARAALECVGYQTRDLVEAMARDWSSTGSTVLRVDGGMTQSDYTMQFLADIIDAPVDRPKVMETTAMGAAYLAGLQAGLLPEPEVFSKRWALERRFTPGMAASTRDGKYQGWQEAVRRTLSTS